MSAATVLIVEDDAAIRRGLCDALTFSGYRVLQAADGQAGLETALQSHIDLVLLDILMPRMDGMEVLKRIREAMPSLPVIFLTAKGQEEDRIRGLRAGADDYVVKPFGSREVLARVEAVLRRTAERTGPVRHLVVAGRRIDLARREVHLPGGDRRPLPDIECRLLEYLAHHQGRAVGRDELLARVWKLDARGLQTRTVDMAVARLREILDDDPTDARVIVTVRAKGYMLAAANDPTAGSGP